MPYAEMIESCFHSACFAFVWVGTAWAVAYCMKERN